MFAIDLPLLSDGQATQLIQQNRGFIPVRIENQDTDHRIVWWNVGDYQFTESKFRYSIEHLTTQNHQVEQFSTDIKLLASDLLWDDTIYPSGFIFHMSRCGSTLLAKSMARVPEHIVIDEGTPLNDGLWHYLTNGWRTPVAASDENLSLLKNIVLALGRKRTSEQQTYFVKFRSWNVIFIDLILRAFPDVPALFIYRDPAEVMVSATMRPVWILDFKGLPPGAFLSGTTQTATIAMSTLEFLTSFYTRYLESALSITSDQLLYLNYDQIQAENLASILQLAFDYSVTNSMLAQMHVQFSYYSKDDSDTIRFLSDKEEKRRAITPDIQQAVAQKLDGLYQKLNLSSRNLNHQLQSQLRSIDHNSISQIIS